MNGLYQKYLDNLAEGHDLAKKNVFLNAEDKETLLKKIRENSRRTYELRRENDEILNTLVYSRNAEDLTEGDVSDLMEFADNLYAFLIQNDIGTSYRVHQLLYKYAEHKNDVDMCIRQRYHLGSNLFYLNLQMPELGLNLFGKQITEYFRQNAEYVDRCEEFESKQTRGFIFRSTSNMWLSDESISCKHQPCVPFDIMSTYPAFNRYFNDMMALYTSPKNQALLTDFPWEQGIFNLHFNRCQYCQDMEIHHPREIREAVLESAKYIYDHRFEFSAANSPVQNAQIEYFYASAQYKMGLISASELMDFLLTLAEKADPSDYTMEGISLNLHVPQHLESTYHILSDKARAQYADKVDRFNKSAQEYLHKAPHNEFSNVVTHAVAESIRFRVYHDQSLQQEMFNALLFCHPPTYIHVQMTATLSRMLMTRMAKTAPEKLVGIYGLYDPETIRNIAEELGDRIWLCALYHDVGKLMLLDYISIYGRKLLDEEFTAIKLHPQIGSAMLDHINAPDFSAVSLHHHRFYNGQGGYPEQCPPCSGRYKGMVDIVTVCDCIDAATDDIGRCYSTAKSFDQIIDEIRQQTGSRYSPDVAALFDDETFYKTVEETLARTRRDIYFEVYGNGKFSASIHE